MIVKTIRISVAVVVVMTPDSEKSEWVERELLLAQRLEKPIFPLLLRGHEFPLLITTQYVDVTNGQLPPDEFYDRLGRLLPPKPKHKKPATTPTPSASPDTPAPSEADQHPWLSWLVAHWKLSLVGGGLLLIILGSIIFSAIGGGRDGPTPSLADDAKIETPTPPQIRDSRFPTPISTSISSFETITAADGAPMVLVPAGPFTMGGDSDSHQVNLDAFYIDQYEVTNKQFVDFLNEQGNQEEGGVPWYNPVGDRIIDQGGTWQTASGFDQHPATGVTWYGAKAYCAWRGDRLPTEAEWEKAARGTDERTYPWGDNSPDETLLNFDDNIGDTTPVGSYPEGVSPYGAYDMAGNVWEWTSSINTEYPYDPEDGREDLESAEERVLRGGSWNSYDYIVRAVDRNVSSKPNDEDDDVGFRCAADATE